VVQTLLCRLERPSTLLNFADRQWKRSSHAMQCDTQDANARLRRRADGLAGQAQAARAEARAAGDLAAVLETAPEEARAVAAAAAATEQAGQEARNAAMLALLREKVWRDVSSSAALPAILFTLHMEPSASVS